MATTTPNIGLTKPAGNENVSLTVINHNYDLLDGAIGDLRENASTTAPGLMSAADKSKLDGVAAGATANVGTITGINMNGQSKGTSGVVDLGTVITEHQDISGKLDAPSTAGTSGQYLMSDGQGGQQWSTPAGGGTITGINMNGQSKGTSGVVDLGTVLTEHQDISGKLDAPSTAGTSGQYLMSDGQGGQQWSTPAGGGTITGINMNGQSKGTSGVVDLGNVVTSPATAGTSGQVLTSDGQGGQTWQTPPSGLPAVTSSNNGAFLRVVDGAWAVDTVPSANGVSF